MSSGEVKQIQSDKIEINAGGNKALAVLCSGSDAQGMNSTVRAVLRIGFSSGYRVFFVIGGYRGLIDSNIEEAKWDSVTGKMQLGGTFIGSGSCDEFKAPDGRKKAAFNLVNHEPSITNLVVIGGKGSLAGANVFHEEWPSLLEELQKEGKITEEKWGSCKLLKLVGIAASIMNDVCDTDMTIGADSALHRITEMIDSITTIEHFRQQCYVFEVAGRDCGYLALVSALACEADWLLIPERPQEKGWEDTLCKKFEQSKEQKQPVHIIIVAEGARDSEGEPLTAEKVRDILKPKLAVLKFDVRSTVLGPIQRSGVPSAFDRVLSTLMGTEAVYALKTTVVPVMIALQFNELKRVPLEQVIKDMNAIDEALLASRSAPISDPEIFKKLVSLRGETFSNNFSVYKELAKPTQPPIENTELNWGIVHIGAPTAGMNAVTRAFVRMAMLRGYRVLGIKEGLESLVADEKETSGRFGLRLFNWSDVFGWNSQGGSNLGSSRSTAEEVGLENIAKAIKLYKLKGLLIIGGFDGYMTAIQLVEGREKHSELRIPICVIPATISNNVPGSDFTLGADTALNEIVDLCDRIRQSATGTMRRVFVVETMGHNCGYLATMAGIAGGADTVYIFEKEINIANLVKDLEHMQNKFDENVNVKCGLIIRNEFAHEKYTTDFIEKLYSAESKGLFSCRSIVLGQVLHGGFPSTFDRLYGTKLATCAIEFFVKHMQPNSSDSNEDDRAVLIGIKQCKIVEEKFAKLKTITDFEHRKPKDNSQWWMYMHELLRTLKTKNPQ